MSSLRARFAYPLTLLLLALAASPGRAQAQDPEAPPGLDPGGPAVAIISTGLDYTDPVIAPRLARDGEGQPIAWDFVDNDQKPHARDDGGDGTRLAKLILKLNDKVRIINVRVSRREPDMLAKAAMFVARTPARVAVIGVHPEEQVGWEQFAGVARQPAGHVLFVVPEGPPAAETGGSAYPVQLNLTNTLTAAPLANPGAQGNGEEPASADVLIRPRDITEGENKETVPADSVEAAALFAGLAACLLYGLNIKDMGEAKATLKESAVPAKEAGRENVYDPVCAKKE